MSPFFYLPTTMNKADCFEWGRVVKPQGLKGAITVHIDADNPDHYQGLDAFFIELEGLLVPYLIEEIKINNKNKAIIKLEDVNTVEAAQALVKNKIFLPLGALPPLEKGQFYYHDLIGYTVVDKQKGKLGKVATFYSKPGQDLLAMEYEGKEVLIPVTDDVVLAPDFEKNTVHVNLPEGLLEIYL